MEPCAGGHPQSCVSTGFLWFYDSDTGVWEAGAEQVCVQWSSTVGFSWALLAFLGVYQWFLCSFGTMRFHVVLRDCVGHGATPQTHCRKYVVIFGCYEWSGFTSALSVKLGVSQCAESIDHILAQCRRQAQQTWARCSPCGKGRVKKWTLQWRLTWNNHRQKIPFPAWFTIWSCP